MVGKGSDPKIGTSTSLLDHTGIVIDNTGILRDNTGIMIWDSSTWQAYIDIIRPILLKIIFKF